MSHLLTQFRVPPHHSFTALPDPDTNDVDQYGEGSRVQHSSTTQGSCFGLPYQDHNYGAPPPPTPPPSPPPPTRLNGGLNGHLDGVDVDIEDVSLNTTVITSAGGGGSQDQDTSPMQASLADQDDSIDDSITRCICDYVHDDGYMICCDRCSVWQHVDCMGVDRSNIPEIYYCERCEPRKLNKQRAVQLQTRKREVLLIDTSATESENETKQFAEKPRNRKKKMEKKDIMAGKLANGNRKTKKFDHKDGKRKLGSRKIPPQLNIKKSPGNMKIVRSPVATKEEGSVLPWHSKQYADTYEEAPGNLYSPGVQELLFQSKLNGLNSRSETKPPLHLQAQMCRVSQFGENQKGLEALEHLALGQPLLEYKGNVMLRDQYNQEKLFFQRFQPHVLFYPNIDDLDLCIDASTYGNDARHVRRSCSPNAEVRHFLDGNQVYFYIFTTKSIPKGYEITVPFDFSYQECNYYVDCACSKPNCMVAKYHKGITTNSEEIPLQVPTKAAKKQKKIPKGLDEPLHIDIGKAELKPAPMTSPPMKRRRLSSHNASKDKGTPVKEDHRQNNLASPKTPGLASPSFSGPSDHEGEDGDKPNKKMSREDRKLAAIMKAFEKLEKQQERKKESHHKGEHDKSHECEVVAEAVGKHKPKSRSKSGSKPEHRAEEVSPVSPTLPLLKVKEKKEKTVKEIRKSSTEKRRLSKTAETVKSETSEDTVHVKEEVPEEKPIESEEPPAPSVVVAESPEIKQEKYSPVQNEDLPLPTQEVVEQVKEEGMVDCVQDVHTPHKSEPQPTALAIVDTPVLLREERPRVAKGKKKRGGNTPARRKSRFNSSVSTTTTDSADEEAVSSVPQTPNTASSLSQAFDSSSSTPQTPCVEKGFKFPKTKKHLMSEWLSEKSTDSSSSPTRLNLLPARIEPLEINVSAAAAPSRSPDAEADFVKCVPSPHTNSLSHLRRSSVSSLSSHTRAVDSIPGGVQLDTSLGSAKKRWLRQVMFERSSSVPAGKENVGSTTLSPVAQSCATSPAASPPADFVTPLKKRRFARESLCQENPYGQAPTTPPLPQLPPTHSSSSTAGTPPEEQEAFSPHSSLDQLPSQALLQQQQQLDPTSMQEEKKNGICINKLNNLAAQTDNIFERIGIPRKAMLCDSVDSTEKHSSHSTERKLLFDKPFENSGSSEVDMHGDLNVACSQGFEISVCESSSITDHCTSNTILQPGKSGYHRTFTESESEAAASTSECDYNPHKQTVDLNSSSHSVLSECSSHRLEPAAFTNSGEKQCEASVHRSGKTSGVLNHEVIVASPKHSLNVSRDSGLISDQEKTCSSSGESSVLQDSMCSSFDSSTESVKGGHSADVDSSQGGVGVTLKQSSCSGHNDHHLSSSLRNNNTCEALHKTVACEGSNRVLCVDSSRDHHKCLESRGVAGNAADSFTETQYCANNSSHSKTDSVSSDTGIVSSLVDAVETSKLYSGSSQDNLLSSEDDTTVSCSVHSSGEAEAKVTFQTDLTATVVKKEHGEMPSHSTNHKKTPYKTDSEKEEGEITDDEDEEIVDSSSVVVLPTSQIEKDPDTTNEAENAIINSGNSPSAGSSTSACKTTTADIPQAYRLENNNQGEVSSSRSTSPYWDNSLYRKRGWWRQEKDPVSIANNNVKISTPPSSNQSSPSSAQPESPRTHQPVTATDSKSDEVYTVDSTTTERRTISGSSSSHSPIVSSSEMKSLRQDNNSSSTFGSGALENCESLSPRSMADSLTSHIGFGQMCAPFGGKKKVSLLEYRKRMKQRSHDVPTVQVSISSVSRSNSTGSSGNNCTQSAPTAPLYPTLPVFPNLSNPINKEKKMTQQQQPSNNTEDYNKKKKEEEVKWSATATMAERIREQTHITLTERLRKEFGLDTVDDTEEKEESDDEPPPPPPPPPAPQMAAALSALPAPPHPPQVLTTQALNNLSSVQAQSLIQQTMLAVVSSAQAVVLNQQPGTQPSHLPTSHNALLPTPTNPALQIPTTNPVVSSSAAFNGGTGVVTVAEQTASSSNSQPLIMAPNLPLHLQAPSSSTPVITPQSVIATGADVPSQAVVTAIDAATVLNNNKQTQSFHVPKQAMFLPLPTLPPTHLFTHSLTPSNNSMSHPQLGSIPQPPIPQLPPITPQPPSQELSHPPTKSLLLPGSLVTGATQSITPVNQGLLPTPTQSQVAVGSRRIQQNNVDTMGIPSLLAIPTMPTKIFNRLGEDASFVALEQDSLRDTVEYSSTGPASESSTLPESSFSTPTQTQLLVNYNHGFPPTGLN